MPLALTPTPATHALILFLFMVAPQAHEAADPRASSAPEPKVKALPPATETRGPWRNRPQAPAGASVSGQGYWTFTAAAPGVLPLPPETRPFIKGAHGTLIVDAARDVVYWGLERVGWVGFSNRLTASWVVRGDPVFARGNLHGADLLPRGRRAPLVAVADNVDGEVYLSDTTFQGARKLDWPQGGPYRSKQEFHPTDVAFTGPGSFFVTDGYGQAYFMPATVDPLAYQGTWLGGKAMSKTPHGISLDPEDGSLVIAARPEGQLRHWDPKGLRWLEVAGLPRGSTVCDVDILGDYALAPCLDGPDQSPGPIYVLNLRRRTLVATLRPKEDLGFSEAQHIHDAAWYVTGKGRSAEVHVLFTAWNPGGLGALKLVQTPGR